MKDKKIVYTPEEMARMEIRDFVNKGLAAVKNNEVYDFDEVFDQLEERYKNDKAI